MPKEEEGFKINNFSFPYKEQINHKEAKQKEIRVREEINGIEDRKTRGQSMKQKTCSLKISRNLINI